MVFLSATITLSNQNKLEISQNLSNIEFTSRDRRDAQLPSWGIMSNSGTLEARDDNGVLKQYAKDGLLENATIDIYLNVNSRKEHKGKFVITGAEENRQTALVELEFEDVLKSWQSVQMPVYYYPYYPRQIYANDILQYIAESSGFIVNYADEQTENRLKKLYVEFPTLEEGSLWAQMTKICEVGSCYIYSDDNGVPNIYYGGGT